MGGYKRSSDEQRIRMVGMLTIGKSIRDVSEAVNLSDTTVQFYKAAIDVIPNRNWEELKQIAARWKSIDSIKWIADFYEVEIPEEVMAYIRIGIDGNRYGRRNPNAEKNQEALEKVTETEDRKTDNTAEAFVSLLKKLDTLIQKTEESNKILKEIAMQKDSDFEAYLDSQFKQIISGVNELATTEDVKDAVKDLTVEIVKGCGDIEGNINTNSDIIFKAVRDGAENVRKEVVKRR